MSNITPGKYRIILKANQSSALALGVKFTPVRPGVSNPTLILMNQSDPALGTWSVEPIEGTDGFRLIYSDVLNGAVTFKSTGDPIGFNITNPYNEECVLHADDVGDGWVAINNHDRTRVFDGRGDDPTVGSDVICFAWNGGDNQRWQFIPISV